MIYSFVSILWFVNDRLEIQDFRMSFALTDKGEPRNAIRAAAVEGLGVQCAEVQVSRHETRDAVAYESGSDGNQGRTDGVAGWTLDSGEGGGFCDAGHLVTPW